MWKKIDILNLFNETEIDGVSIASMFHYFYHKQYDESKKLKNIKFLEYDNFFEGISIRDLKNILKITRLKLDNETKYRSC